jgi:hypothetical protein
MAADSPDRSTRCRGTTLATSADQDDVAGILHRLLLDRDDTAVVEATCLALLRSDDAHGTRLVAEAITRAQAPWPAASTSSTTPMTPSSPTLHRRPEDDYLASCDTLTHGSRPRHRTGARKLTDWARP